MLNSKLKLKQSLLAHSLVIGGLVVSASACKQIKNLDEMHDSTVGMSQKMDVTNNGVKETSQTSKEMKELVAETNKTSREMKDLITQTNHSALWTYTDLRQGNTLTIRANALKNMNEAEAMETKIDEAGMYYMALEFQLWKDRDRDTQKVREILYNDAMMQFFRDIHRYMDGKMKIDPTSKKNNMKNLSALAVAMHQVNPNQKVLVELQGIQEESLLSLIKETLKKRPDVDSGKIKWADVPQYEREILTNEKEAIYMLQLRANFLPMMVLEKLTRINEKNILQQAMMLVRGFDADIDGLNYAQLQEYPTWIKESSDTLAYLKDVTGDFKINKKVVRLYQNLRMPVTRGDAYRMGAVGGLISEIDRFRNTIGIDTSDVDAEEDDAPAGAPQGAAAN